MELYEKIQFLRKTKNMTQSQLADHMDISRQAIQKWENGITSPDITKLPDLANLFEITVDMLLDNNITSEELLIRNNKIKDDNQINHQKQNTKRSILDYMLLVPFLMGIFIVIGMFYVVGAFFIGMLFFTSFSAVIASFASFIYMFIYIKEGIGAILLFLSITLICLGMILPFYKLATLWMKKYTIWAAKLTKKIKGYNFRGLL